MDRTVEPIPTWALNYLVNGDATGLTADDIREADSFIYRLGVQVVCPICDDIEGSPEPYFSRYPAFGLPTEVEDCIVIYN